MTEIRKEVEIYRSLFRNNDVRSILDPSILTPAIHGHADYSVIRTYSYYSRQYLVLRVVVVYVRLSYYGSLVDAD